jgi:stage V sporulation protein B
MKEPQSLFTGTMVLAGASFVNRMLGFVYQIFLIRLIKAEGIGLFSMVFPIYILVLVLASFGIPVAIAKLVADAATQGNRQRAYRILRLALVYTSFFSLTLTVIGVLSARFITGQVLSNPSTYLPFICLMPGVFIVSMSSVFRGFFQGFQYMTPTAASQTAEQLIRVTVGLCLASLLINQGIVAAACGACLGVVIGELGGFMLMLLYFIRSRDLQPRLGGFRVRESGYLTGAMFRLAFPITLMRLVSTGFLSLEAVIIPHRLMANGFSTHEATEAYGLFAGIAETLLYTPGLITVALSTALVPAIAEAQTARDFSLLNSRVNNAMRCTVIVGLPSLLVFLVLARDLCAILFGYPEAGAALQVLAIGAPFLYLQQTTTGVLQGLGEPMVPFRNLVIASVFKVAGIYALTGCPAYGIRGAAAAVVSGFIIMSVLNLIDLRKITDCRFKMLEIVFKPLAGTAAATTALCFAYKYLVGEGIVTGFNLFGSIFIAGIVYGVCLILIGALSKEERDRLGYVFCKIFLAIKK